MGVVTGDYHALWAAELRSGPRGQAGKKLRKRHTLASEWCTPSVATGVRNYPTGLLRTWLTLSGQNHIRWAEPNPNGFTVLSVTPFRMQGDFYVLNQDDYLVRGVKFGKGLYRTQESGRMHKTREPQKPLGVYPPLADAPMGYNPCLDVFAPVEKSPFHLEHVFPPLLQNQLAMRVRYKRLRELTARVFDRHQNERITFTFVFTKKTQTLQLDVATLQPGRYTLALEAENGYTEKLDLYKPPSPSYLTRP